MKIIFFFSLLLKVFEHGKLQFFTSVMGRSRKYVHNGSRPAFTGSAKLAYGNIFRFPCLSNFIGSEGFFKTRVLID